MDEYKKEIDDARQNLELYKQYVDSISLLKIGLKTGAVGSILSGLRGHARGHDDETTLKVASVVGAGTGVGGALYSYINKKLKEKDIKRYEKILNDETRRYKKLVNAKNRKNKLKAQ